MRRLLISDVHANLPAFQAVLRDAGRVDEIVFFGDIVGFGPHPSDCVDLLREIGAKAVLGNHDFSIISKRKRAAALPVPVDWDDWTRCHLTDSQFRYLATLPREMRIESCGVQTRVIHQPVGAPYLDPAMPDEVLTEHFGNVPGNAVYCGHSHRLIDRVVDSRRIICLRAIGQSRDGDPRAGYSIEENACLEHRNVEYDIDSVVQDIRQIGLPESFLIRWIRFLKTGFDSEWSREYSNR